MLNGKWTDFITDFLTFTENQVSPEIHRKWAGISCLAGALERRVWVRAGELINYPNLYIILVAPPGTGKYVIETVRELWTDTVKPNTEIPAFHIAPDSVTRASLIDDLSDAKCSFIPPTSPIYTYHALLVPSEEFEILMPGYDPHFIASFNSFFNAKPYHRETRRYGHRQNVEIVRPLLHVLAGTTPSYYNRFPDDAWNTGLIRRIIMVYASDPPYKDLFQSSIDRTEERKRLLHRLAQLSSLYGQATWENDSWKLIEDWHRKGEQPLLTHSRLTYYNRTRAQFILKLSLVSAVSRLGVPTIEPSDVIRAMEWLFEAEAQMPSIFRAMQGKSDGALLEELWHFVQAVWNKHRLPTQTSQMKRFLSIRAPEDKIDGLIRLAEGTDMIVRKAGTEDLWLPRPKDQHGME